MPRIGQGHWNRRDTLLSRSDFCPANGVHLRLKLEVVGARGRVLFVLRFSAEEVLTLPDTPPDDADAP